MMKIEIPPNVIDVYNKMKSCQSVTKDELNLLSNYSIKLTTDVFENFLKNKDQPKNNNKLGLLFGLLIGLNITFGYALGYVFADTTQETIKTLMRNLL